MKVMKTSVLVSLALVGAIGCSSNSSRNMQSSADMRDSDITRAQAERVRDGMRDPAVVRGEERVVNAQNWREVQKLLAQKGYNPGSRDGLVSDQTRDAIRNYQRNNRIAASGLLDSQTLIKMEQDGAGFTGTLGAQLERADGNPTLGED